MDSASLIASFYRDFADFPKPEHSVDFRHCEECAEYDALLRDVTHERLSMEAIGTICWGPVTHLTADAMAYYLPRFMQLAVNGDRNTDGELFACQFLLQIGHRGRGRRNSLPWAFDSKPPCAIAWLFWNSTIWTKLSTTITEIYFVIQSANGAPDDVFERTSRGRQFPHRDGRVSTAA
ncbi:MAG: hypothetical protein ABI411_05460 [Tahibacter sp.]